MALCRNCGSQFKGTKDLCSSCLSVSPACPICGRQLDDHSLTYTKDKYPPPACPPKGADLRGASEGIA